MAFRRVAMFLVVAAVGLAACGGDDDHAESGVAVEEPIGAPEAVDEYGSAPLEAPPSVEKSARVDMEVPRADLSDAAQAVVDLATSDQVGGFLSSSIVDLEDGYGSANILVKVPAARFEQTVSRLGDLGDVTRQEMAGRDLSPGALEARQAVGRARRQIAALTADVEAAGAAEKEALRSRLAAAKADLREAAGEREYVAAQTAYSPIDVALAAKQPPPPPEESAVERALGTAKSISLAIVSAAIVGAGVVLPVGAVVLALWLTWSLVIRRLRLRWEEIR